MTVFIEHDISGHTFLILSQEYYPNDIIGRTFILLPQEYGHKFWFCIVTMINDHETKVAQESGHTQFIN